MHLRDTSGQFIDMSLGSEELVTRFNGRWKRMNTMTLMFMSLMSLCNVSRFLHLFSCYYTLFFSQPPLEQIGLYMWIVDEHCTDTGVMFTGLAGDRAGGARPGGGV